jgi:hypothetical protein
VEALSLTSSQFYQILACCKSQFVFRENACSEAPNLDQLFGLLNAGQRCKKNRLDPGEDCCIGADAQSQGDYDCKGETWFASEST